MFCSNIVWVHRGFDETQASRNEVHVEDEQDDPGAATVLLDVPVDSRSLRLLRLAAADAAATAGHDVDRVETSRLVMDELASVLLGVGGGGRMRISITRGDGALLVFEGSLSEPPEGSVELDFIVRELLDASIGRPAWSFEDGERGPRFRAEVAPRRAS